MQNNNGMNTKISKKSWIGIPPLVIIGAVLILVPIFLFLTLDSINRQKESAVDLLKEKGAALIRSFEAGARTGMMGMRWGGAQVQRLLSETAQQPDIAYILITSVDGTILADNDLSRIGTKYKSSINLERVSRSKKLEWRQVTGKDGSRIFEVFRRFSPIRRVHRGRHVRFTKNDWCRGHMIREGNAPGSRQIIFLGLDMGPVEAARQEDIRRSIFTALTLLLIGFAGIVSLFLAQAYRSTKTSLSKVKAFSDNLVHNMPMGLLAIDADGRIASFNQAAESVLRLSSGDTIGKRPAEILPRPLSDFFVQLKTMQGLIDKELDCPVKDGRIIPLEVVGTALKEENSSVVSWVILFRDLTEIQRLKKEIARSQRLASIGRLAAGVAHEIRNPLSSIKGFATYFKERYRDIPEDHKTAEIMVQEVERLNRVISQLLEFARPLNIQKKETFLEVVIKDSLKMVEGDARQKGIKVDFSNDLRRDEAWIDPDRIRQVLLNLYLNAIQAMEKGGTLSVRLKQEDDTGRFRIIVSDTGKGIKKEDLPNLFDPYFTTKPSGTGLGLAIVHKIIESHGGEVGVESHYGEGSIVTIRLPYGRGETSE